MYGIDMRAYLSDLLTLALVVALWTFALVIWAIFN